jgi:hypothetical protein
VKKLFVMFVLSTAVATGASAQTAGASGIYVGAGISWDAFKVEDLSFGDGSVSVNGLDIAGFGGYRFRIGRVTLGPEVGVSFSFAEGNDGEFLLPASAGLSFDVRARVGFPTGRVEPYVAVGLVRTRFEADHQGGGAADDIAKDSVRALVIAGGVDWSIDDQSFVRGEFGWMKRVESVFPFYGGSDPHAYSAGGMKLAFAYGRIF